MSEKEAVKRKEKNSFVNDMNLKSIVEKSLDSSKGKLLLNLFWTPD